MPSEEEDDEIQFLYAKSSEPFLCQLCPANLNKQTAEQKQAHYELHLKSTEEPPVSTSSTELNTVVYSKPSSKTNNPLKWKIRNDPFWYSTKSDPPPSNFTPCLIPILRKALEKSNLKGNTLRGAVCYDKTVHIARDDWDAGWGCGYRNFLMVCTALMEQRIQPLYYPLLDAPIPPSVRNLQRWIEAAWEAGFDEEGAKQLKKLVDTKTWVGTSDLWVAFVFRGIPAELVDFDLKNNTEGVKAVTDWVVNYFCPPEKHNHNTVTDVLRGATAVISTERMPVILQHDGHSQTIIGYEINKSGTINLLAFDPSKPPSKKIRDAALASLLPSKSHPPAKAPHSASSSHDPSVSIRVAPNSTKRRRPSESNTSNELATKRSRSGENDLDDDEVIIISDSMDERSRKPEQLESYKTKRVQKESWNPTDVLSFFRVNAKKFKGKSRYQILYFPLDAPLDEAERLSNKVVVSSKIC